MAAHDATAHTSPPDRRAPPRPPPRCARALPFIGPAFVAAIAYVDPGNFATNIAGGAKFGYLLLWVILAANLMAMLIQYLSAKVGVATGRSLPELCREHLPRRVSFGLWIQAELIAMATDLAEFVGRRDRTQPPLRAPAAAGRAGDGGRLVRAARAAEPRLPAVRDRDRRHARRDPARLPRRHAARPARRGGHRRRPHPRLRRHRLAAARHRHPRRDRDAARDLPALGADPAPDRDAQRRREAAADARSSGSTC